MPDEVSHPKANDEPNVNTSKSPRRRKTSTGIHQLLDAVLCEADVVASGQLGVARRGSWMVGLGTRLRHSPCRGSQGWSMCKVESLETRSQGIVDVCMTMVRIAELLRRVVS